MGYDPSSVPFRGLATIEALSGHSAGIDKSFGTVPMAAEIREHEAAPAAEATQVFKCIGEQWGDHDA